MTSRPSREVPTADPPSVVAAVIGDPARHSRSPAVHNAAFRATGLDWIYTAFEVSAGQGSRAIDAMRILGLGGLSVTMPLKEVVAECVDEASEAVATLRATNCVVPLGDGRLRAENTDGAGFIRGLRDDAGIAPAGRRFVVLGAGGAARAVVHGLHGADAGSVVVVNRSSDRAHAAADLALPVGRVGSLDDIGAADVIVNATAVGMADDGAVPCPTELIRPGQVAVDLIYSPVESVWLAQLRERGIEAHNGLSMLVHQAAVAFEMWTGVDAPLEVMRAAVHDPVG